MIFFPFSLHVVLVVILVPHVRLHTLLDSVVHFLQVFHHGIDLTHFAWSELCGGGRILENLKLDVDRFQSLLELYFMRGLHGVFHASLDGNYKI